MKRAGSLLALLAVALGALALNTSAAAAQSPGEAQGVITGTIELGTAGATLSDDLRVQFIVLVASEVEGTQDATVEGDTVRLDVPIDPERRYLPTVTYEGVQYLGEVPVAVTAEQPEVEATLPTVYASTDSPEGVRIAGVSASVTRVDWTNGEVVLQRTDTLLTDADRTYVGSSSGATIRIPVPEGTTSAEGETLRGPVTQEESLLVANTPIPPGESTILGSAYQIGYDPTEDEYVLRVTVPFAADVIRVQIPEDWVDTVEVQGAGREGDHASGTLEDGTEVTLRTFVLEDAAPGDSLVLRMSGLAPSLNRNPLTEPPGSLIAGAVALAVVGAAGAYAVARGRQAAA